MSLRSRTGRIVLGLCGLVSAVFSGAICQQERDTAGAVTIPLSMSDGFIAGRPETAPFTMAFRCSPGIILDDIARLGITGAAMYVHPAWVGAVGVYVMIQPMPSWMIAGHTIRTLWGVEGLFAGGGHRFGCVTSTIDVDRFILFGLRADYDPDEAAAYWQGFLAMDLASLWR